jgi:hypothetical protein
MHFTVHGDTLSAIHEAAIKQTADFLELDDPGSIDSHADIEINVEDLQDSEKKYQATIYVRIKK